jgi:hypothetical protein
MEPKMLSQQLELISKKLDEVRELKELILIHKTPFLDISDVWLPRPIVMKFFGYADTQMTAVAKKHNFISTKIGAKIFYHKDSIIKALNENIYT